MVQSGFETHKTRSQQVPSKYPASKLYVLSCESVLPLLCLEMDLQSACKRCIGFTDFYGRVLVVEKGVTAPKGEMRG